MPEQFNPFTPESTEPARAARVESFDPYSPKAVVERPQPDTEASMPRQANASRTEQFNPFAQAPANTINEPDQTPSNDLPRPNEPEDGFWEGMGKTVQSIIPSLKSGVGGTVQAAGETPIYMPDYKQDEIYAAASRMAQERDLVPEGAPAAPTNETLREAALKIAGKGPEDSIPNRVADTGKEIYTEAQDELAQLQPNVEERSPTWYAYQLTRVMGEMAPGVALSVATRKPILGATQMGQHVYGHQYGDSRNVRGRSPDEARTDALFYGISELVTERIPLGILAKEGLTFGSRFAKAGLSEGAQEALTEAIQIGYENGVFNDDTTLGEAVQRITDAAILGAGAGSGMATVVEPVHRLTRNKADAQNNDMGEPEFATTPVQEAAQALDPKSEDVVRPTPDAAELERARVMAEGARVLSDEQVTSEAQDPSVPADAPAQTDQTPPNAQVVGGTVPEAPQDPAQREVGQIYRSPTGQLGRWTGEAWQLVDPKSQNQQTPNLRQERLQDISAPQGAEYASTPPQQPAADRSEQSINIRYDTSHAEPVFKPTVDRERLAREVLEIARTIAPKADARVVEELFGVLPKRGMVNVAGAYRPAKNLIEVATNLDNPKATVRHEGVHALKSMGLFTPREWQILETKARHTWIADHNIERRYAGLSAEQKIEEAIASAFADYATGQTAHAPTIQRLMEKIRLFLERLRNALHGQGFRSIEDIFYAVETGTVGTRPVPGFETTAAPEAAPAYAMESAGDKFSVAEETLTAQERRRAKRKRKAEAFKFDDATTEQRWAEARKGREDPKAVVQRSKDWLEHIVHGFTRHHIHLPNVPEFAKAHETLRKVEAAPQAAKEEAVRMLRSITDGMDARDLDLFTRKVVLDDLVHEAGQGHELPLGLTAETLPKEKAKVDRAIMARPEMREALRKRNQFVSKISRGLVSAGILKKEQLTNPAYFHHQVLDYARAQQYHLGSRNQLKTPRPGYAKGRKGSTMDISANYLEAEFEWLHRAQVDITTAKAIASIKEDYDHHELARTAADAANNQAISELLKSGEAKTETDARKVLRDRKQWKEIEDFIPEGHVLWQPDRGNIFFTAKTLPERAVDHLMDAMAHESIPGVSQNELQQAVSQMREALVIGGPKYQMVIPEELAQTLDGLRNDAPTGLFDHVIATPLAWWKRWVLINPRRVLKYNINNLSGDLDAVIAGNPKAVKKMPQAIRELWNVMHGKEPSQRYREAVDRGVFDSGLSAQEIPDIDVMSEFEQVITHPRLKEPGRFSLSLMMKIWRGLQRYTQFRENWLRYAAYLDYVERLESGEPMESIGYGAAAPQMVDAIKDNKDRAALLARELVGDYGNVSAFGQSLRSRVIPFYSWMEINTKRYVRLIGNAYGQGFGQAAKVGAVAGAGISARLALRMAMMYALVNLWNNLLFPDEEDDLSDEERVRLHLNLGRDSDGKVRQLRFQGALSDFLGWFGFEDAVAAASEMEKGRAGIEDILTAVAKAPVNKIGSGITPVIKTPMELLAGQSFWPDVFNPRSIKDKKRHVARLFSLEHEYDWLAERPTRGYGRSIEQAVVSKRDPEENAYNRIRGIGYDWIREERGTEGSSNIQTPRSKALYDWRLAKKFGDRKALRAARKRMLELGMTAKDIKRSITRAHPLGMIPIKYRRRFETSLTPKEQRLLRRAIVWYEQTFKDQ